MQLAPQQVTVRNVLFPPGHGLTLVPSVTVSQGAIMRRRITALALILAAILGGAAASAATGGAVQASAPAMHYDG